MDPDIDQATDLSVSPRQHTYPIMGTPPSSPPPTELPDPCTLGLGNARSPALQTIFTPADTSEFLTLFNLTTLTPLHPRLDVPRGTNFDSFLRRTIHAAQHAEDIPPRVKPWDVKLPLQWTFPAADKVWGVDGVWTFRMRCEGTYEGTVSAVYVFLSRIGMKDGERLLFRGATRHETRVSAAVFKPGYGPRYGCAELGQGVYVYPDMELALAWAGREGVLWVFRRPGFEVLKVLEVGVVEWTGMAAAGNGLKWGGVPAGYRGCDVVYGPVSEDAGPAALQGVPPVQMVGSEQYCFKSAKAFAVLARSLVGMVFLEGGG